MDSVLRDLHRLIDHAVLQPEATEEDVRRACQDARRYHLCAVAVNPVWVAVADTELVGSETKVLSTTGFPLGAARSDIKLSEAIKAVSDGAREIDMVANIGWLVSGQFQSAAAEIAKLRKNLPYNVVLKVIIEAGKLTPRQQMDAVNVVVDGGGQFVKTGTGFFGEATIELVRLLHRAADGRIEVKAAGGIRSLETCRSMLQAGATRLGSSATVAIMREYRAGR
jgi:deoxyribose-phosphate aldolase